MTRQEAVKTLKAWNKDLEKYFEDEKDGIEAHNLAIEALKEPSREQAHWAVDLDGVPYCSSCAEYTLAGWQTLHDVVKSFCYCPKCGAKMVKGE